LEEDILGKLRMNFGALFGDEESSVLGIFGD
jgi:hypothetical protein